MMLFYESKGGPRKSKVKGNFVFLAEMTKKGELLFTVWSTKKKVEV